MKDSEIEMRWRDQQLEENGLLDPDQPTETATIDYQRRMRAEFTPIERQMIRWAIFGEDRYSEWESSGEAK